LQDIVNMRKMNGPTDPQDIFQALSEDSAGLKVKEFKDPSVFDPRPVAAVGDGYGYGCCS
jgi:hypothetical protein